MRFVHVLLLAATFGCGHEDPWSTVPPAPLGPFTPTLPRRLTFNSGDDRAPTLWTMGNQIAYARYDPVESAEPCIAYLPAEGGTLVDMHCPPLPSPAETFVSTWSSPALSLDGSQVAFLWERAGSVAELGSWTAELAIAASDAPQTPTVRVPLQEFLPEGFVNSIIEPVWLNGGTVRMMAAYDSIWKVKGGGAERFTDSLVVPRRLVDVDIASGTLTPVPGSESGSAWAPAAAGGFWIVRRPGQLYSVTNGVAAFRAAFSGPVADIAEVADRIVAAWGDTLVEWIDPVNGTRGQIAMPGPVSRVAPAGGRRFIIEVVRGIVLFGAPANLWLWELP